MAQANLPTIQSHIENIRYILDRHYSCIPCTRNIRAILDRFLQTCKINAQTTLLRNSQIASRRATPIIRSAIYSEMHIAIITISELIQYREKLDTLLVSNDSQSKRATKTVAKKLFHSKVIVIFMRLKKANIRLQKALIYYQHLAQELDWIERS